MGRKPNRVPLLVRKPYTAEARCYHAGRWWTCGKWDAAANQPTPEAAARYAVLVARWAADPGSAVRPAGEYLLTELLRDWLASAEGPTTAVGRKRLRRATVLLGDLLSIPAAGLTPAMLTAWRKGVAAGRSRVTVWAYTVPVLRAYQWAEDAGRVPEGLADRLSSAVRRQRDEHGGKGVGRKGRRRLPADERSVKRVGTWLARRRPDDSPLYALHAVTGARVTELLALTAGVVRRSGVLRTAGGATLDLTRAAVWAADLGGEHKTAHAGKERVLVFGPAARKVLAGLLKGKGPGDRLFPGGTPQRHLRAVKAACKAVGVAHFSPRQLRQTVADRVRDALGIEWVKAYLGHTGGSVAEKHYLSTDLKRAAEAARKVG